MVYWGDFNVIRYLGEKLGDARHSLAVMEFSDFIFDRGLI